MRRISILFLVFLLTTGLMACQEREQETVPLEPAESVSEETEDQEDTTYIFVYVCGAVNQEGVYELPIGSRVYQAVEMAGGFREDADAKVVNQAEILEDEARIYIPAEGENVQEASESDGRININKATKEELMTLPGVGASRADSIIQYREENGAFQSVEDIMQVSGIKEGLFGKIKDLIRI